MYMQKRLGFFGKNRPFRTKGIKDGIIAYPIDRQQSQNHAPPAAPSNYLKKVLDKSILFLYNRMCELKKTFQYAPLAQLAEHLTLNQGVQGSSP